VLSSSWCQGDVDPFTDAFKLRQLFDIELFIELLGVSAPFIQIKSAYKFNKQSVEVEFS